MRATYKGGKKTLVRTTYPSWTFEATNGENVESLAKRLGEFYGSDRHVFISGAGCCVNPEEPLSITYFGTYGVTEWKNEVRSIYSEWKRECAKAW